jgi:hypothetical protein
VHAPAQPLAKGPVLRRRHPELGNEVAPAELGEDPGVDLVGLAGGAMSLTLRAWATWTSQPASASWSLTQTAPLIISTQAFTSGPTFKTSRARPSSLAAIVPSTSIEPVSLIEQKAARP